MLSTDSLSLARMTPKSQARCLRAHALYQGWVARYLADPDSAEAPSLLPLINRAWDLYMTGLRASWM